MTDRMRTNKTLMAWRLAAVLFFAIAGLAFGVGRASATPCTYGPCGNGVVSVTVHYQSNGVITITVTGSNFGHSQPVNISITNPNMSLGSTESTNTGTISATFQLPAGVPAGNHTLTAIDGNSGSTTFATARASGAPPICQSAYSPGHSAIVLAAMVIPTSCLNGALPGNVNVIPPSSGSATKAPAAGNSTFLPLTGADDVGIATAGAGLVCLGGLVVLSSRRRRSQNFS